MCVLCVCVVTERVVDFEAELAAALEDGHIKCYFHLIQFSKYLFLFHWMLPMLGCQKYKDPKEIVVVRAIQYPRSQL